MRREVRMEAHRTDIARGGFVLPLAFAGAVTMWAIAYVGRLPAMMAPSWLIGCSMLVAIAVIPTATARL